MTVPVVRFILGGRETVGAGEGRPYTLVFDGNCRVCNRLVNLLRKWDSRNQIEIIPSQNTTVYARFPWIPATAYTESVQLVGPGGRTWQGAQAIEQLLDILPRGRWIGWVFTLPFVGWLADRFYRWFARNRYRLGCGEHCQLHPQQLDYLEEDAPARPA
jgi:predicted DCC family thiol-disulfide oxidoreductase YuxK